LEDTTKEVFAQLKGGRSINIKNTISSNPTEFYIDSFVPIDNKAHEIKWRDATTDGDHARKESDKVKAIVQCGMVPVRVMFYSPNRQQAKRIQDKIIREYQLRGEAHVGKEAWDYVRKYTSFDLRGTLFKDFALRHANPVDTKLKSHREKS
jgi:hypothetical protein